MSPSASVIIATYKAIPYLELVLTGYCRQSFGAFEIVLGDDGSGPEMATFVEKFSRSSPFPVQYVSQDDDGFRKSRILNSAIQLSRSDYLIFADADCIPHERFVEAHMESSAANKVLCGRRVNLGQAESEALTPQKILSGEVERGSFELLWDGLAGRLNHWEEGIFLANPTFRSLFNRRKPVLFGCNFSVPKPLLERVNGFNEDFVDYWGEDTELQYRLERAGATSRWVRHYAIQYHLYHSQRPASDASRKLLQQAHTGDDIACRNGLRKL